jgi:hypothetical protein
MSQELDQAIVNKLIEIQKRIEDIEGYPAFTYTIKTDTGDPATGKSGAMVENTFDNTLKVWADGAWRQIASW